MKGTKKNIIGTDISFSDEPLHMLRVIRFAVMFGLAIDKRTYEGIARNAKCLSIISVERIMDEMNKILMSPDPSRGILMLHDTGLLNMFLPCVSALDDVKTVNGIKHKNNFIHTLGVLQYVSAKGGSLNVRWAALLHDIGKIKTRKFENNTWTFRHHETEGAKMVEKIGNSLKMPIADTKYIQKLVELHMRPQSIVDNVTDSAIRRLMFDAGDALEDLILLCMADVTSKNDDKVKCVRDGLANLVEKFADLEARDQIRNFHPSVNGDEIMNMLGLKPGRMVGTIKEDVKNAILDGNLENDHDKVVEYIKKRYAMQNVPNEHQNKNLTNDDYVKCCN